MNMAICGIYRIKNQTNGKFYIGSSNNVDKYGITSMSRLFKRIGI